MAATSASIEVPAHYTWPTGLKPWIVVFTASLFFLWEFMQLNMFDTLTPYLMAAFHTNATQMGYLSSTFTLAEVLFLFPAGVLLDHFSTKRMILIAMASGVSATIAFGFTTNLWIACATHFVAGYGGAFCFLGVMKLATRWFAPKHLALVTGLVVTVAMLGGVISQTPLDLLCDAVGWRHAVFIDAAFGALILATIALVISDFPESTRHAEELAKQQLKQLGFWQSIRLAVTNKQNWLCGLYTSFLNLPLAVLGALWGQMYLRQYHGFTFTQASLVTSMLFIGTIVGSPVLGSISDSLKRRRLPMLICAVISLFIFWLIINAQTPSFYFFLGLFLVLGFITSSQVIGYPTITESNPHCLAGSSLGVASVIIIGAYPITQTLFGWLMDHYWDGKLLAGLRVYPPESYDKALWIIPIGFILGLAAAWFIKETYCRNLDTQ